MSAVVRKRIRMTRRHEPAPDLPEAAAPAGRFSNCTSSTEEGRGSDSRSAAACMTFENVPPPSTVNASVRVRAAGSEGAKAASPISNGIPASRPAASIDSIISMMPGRAIPSSASRASLVSRASAWRREPAARRADSCSRAASLSARASARAEIVHAKYPAPAHAATAASRHIHDKYGMARRSILEVTGDRYGKAIVLGAGEIAYRHRNALKTRVVRERRAVRADRLARGRGAGDDQGARRAPRETHALYRDSSGPRREDRFDEFEDRWCRGGYRLELPKEHLRARDLFPVGARSGRRRGLHGLSLPLFFVADRIGGNEREKRDRAARDREKRAGENDAGAIERPHVFHSVPRKYVGHSTSASRNRGTEHGEI